METDNLLVNWSTLTSDHEDQTLGDAFLTVPSNVYSWQYNNILGFNSCKRLWPYLYLLNRRISSKQWS